MMMDRILRICSMLALAVIAVSCAGNSSLGGNEATVFLTIDIEEYNPDIDVCLSLTDIAISQLSISSETVDPAGTVSANQDVTLDRWVITPYRTDGGTTASPEWIVDQGVYVPAGGQANLQNWRIFPLEYLYEVPLLYLHPENGGFDPETGNTNIRQALELQIFGETVSGKKVATEKIPIAFNFFCAGQ
jgi:hypothetical protein